MSNTYPSYGILSTDTFKNLRTAAARLDRYSKNFSADIANAGSAVTVGYEDNISASLWNPTSGYTTADSVISSTTVTLAEPYHVEVYLSPNEFKSYGESYIQGRMANVASGVFDEIRKKALEKLVASATSVVANVSASAHNFNTVLSASTVLCNSGSQGAQTFLCPRATYNALLADAKNSNYQVSSTMGSGVESFQYNMLPNVTIVPETFLTTPIIATGDAVALAIRLPEQMQGHARTIFADVGQTEAAVAVDLFEDGVAGKVKMRAQACAGVATGRPGAAAKFTTP